MIGYLLQMGHSEFNQIKTFPFLFKAILFGKREIRLSFLFSGKPTKFITLAQEIAIEVNTKKIRRKYFIKKLLSENKHRRAI